MNKTLYKIELFVDRIIPYLLIILLIVIILELVFREGIEPYYIYTGIFDYFVVAVFCIDLIFKYIKIRKIPKFLRKYWLDMIAVFPFFLAFRLFEEIYMFASMPRLLTDSQVLIYRDIALEKEGLRLVNSAEGAGRLSRTRLIFRFIRPLMRLPRFVKIIPYFERPTKKHHEAIESISREKSKKDK